MSTEEAKYDERHSTKESILIHLAKQKRWNDVKVILTKHYKITDEAEAIICSTLIENLLISFNNISKTPNINLQIFEKVFNNAFEDLSCDTINELYNIFTNNIKKKELNYNKILNHNRLPIILLTLYNKHSSDQIHPYFSTPNNARKTFKSDREDLEYIINSIESTDHIERPKEFSVRVNIPTNSKNDLITKFGTVITSKKHIKYGENSYDNLNDNEINSLLDCGYIELKNNHKIYTRSPAWLSCDIRLDDIANKEQNFELSGWINVIWKEPKYSDLYAAIMHCYYHETNIKNIWHFNDQIGMRILDLRDAEKISYYLPIDARRIFDQTSVKHVIYRDPPYLVFNIKTGIIRTEYNITAQLSEHFELFWFPFDKQFLNIKIRWNIDYYRILHWKNEQATNIKGIPNNERYHLLYYDKPLKVNVVEELQNDVNLHEPWIGLEEKLEDRESGLRFALIRLRFTRNPMYYAIYILIPLFLIVLCGFSVYGISINDPAGRLEVSITVLLTFTAFQSIISAELPNTSELVMMDYFIIFAYVIQTLIIFGTAYPYLSNGQVDDTESFDESFATWLFLLWISMSVVYIGGGLLIWSIYKCCGKTGKEFSFCDTFFWQKRARQEIEQWQKEKEAKHGFVMRIGLKDTQKQTYYHPLDTAIMNQDKKEEFEDEYEL